MTYLSYKIVSVRDSSRRPLCDFPALSTYSAPKQNPTRKTFSGVVQQTPRAVVSTTSWVHFPPLGGHSSNATHSTPADMAQRPVWTSSPASGGAAHRYPPEPYLPQPCSGQDPPSRRVPRKTIAQIKHELDLLFKDLSRWHQTLSAKVTKRALLTKSELDEEVDYVMDTLTSRLPTEYAELDPFLKCRVCSFYQKVISQFTFYIIRFKGDGMFSDNASEKNDVIDTFVGARSLLCEDLVSHAYHILEMDRSTLFTVDAIKEGLRKHIGRPYDPQLEGVNPALQVVYFLYHALAHNYKPCIFLADLSDSPFLVLPSKNDMFVVFVELLVDIMCRMPPERFDRFFTEFLIPKRKSSNWPPFVTLIKDLKDAISRAMKSHDSLDFSVFNLTPVLRSGSWLSIEELRHLAAYANRTYSLVVLQESSVFADLDLASEPHEGISLWDCVAPPKSHKGPRHKKVQEAGVFDWKEALNKMVEEDTKRAVRATKQAHTPESRRPASAAAAAAPGSPRSKETTPSNRLQKYITTSEIIKSRWSVNTTPITDILRDLKYRPFIKTINNTLLLEEFKILSKIIARADGEIHRSPKLSKENYKFTIFGSDIPYTTIKVVLTSFKEVLDARAQGQDHKKSKNARARTRRHR